MGDEKNFQFIFPLLGRRMTAKQKKVYIPSSIIEVQKSDWLIQYFFYSLFPTQIESKCHVSM